MSADNSIIILKTKDEFRVGHFQAHDNLYWIWGDTSNDLIVPIRVFEFFHNIDPISATEENCQEKVLSLAHKLHDEIGYVEYGIIAIEIKNTFKELAKIAMIQADEEIHSISKNKNLSTEKKYNAIEEIRNTTEDIIEWMAKNR